MTAPITIELQLSLDEDGSLNIRYSGNDERTYEVGDAIVAAIAEAEDFHVEEIYKGNSL